MISFVFSSSESQTGYMEFTKSMVTMAEFSGEEHLFYSVFYCIKL